MIYATMIMGVVSMDGLMMTMMTMMMIVHGFIDDVPNSM